MRLNKLNRLIKDADYLDKLLIYYEKKKLIKKQKKDSAEINGHLEKSAHNLEFIKDNLEEYPDWAITGCYYAAYHAALALILTKGFVSKNHDATLCILIKEYFKNGINKEDIEFINELFLDYQDLLFYIQSKDKREQATYSSSYKFDKKEVEDLRLKTINFINKVKEILKN